MRKFTFFKALFSPFKPFKLKWHIGKIALGTPYFFPRRWRYLTKEEAKESVNERLEKLRENGKEATVAMYKEFYESAKRSKRGVPKKIGFDFVSLGWKWKYDDIRFEWSPMWSFVFFKWQIAVVFVAPHLSHYWESWLYYELETDKSKSKKERIAECREKAAQTWTAHQTGKDPVTTDYYDLILRTKYL